LTVPPPPHVCGVVHVPQLAVRVAPQLSAAITIPQFLPTRVQNAVFVSATQLGPHTFATPPPPHVCGAVHVPQFAVCIVPQLSAAITIPQLLPLRLQKVVSDSGVHTVPQTFGVPPPPHVMPIEHVPHIAPVRGAPQLSGAVTLPQFLLSRAQNATSDSATQASPLGPASEDPPPEPPPPTPAPDEPPVVAAGEPPDPVAGPAPDEPPDDPVVSLAPPLEPPVPDVTPTGGAPATPVEPGPVPPVFVSRPGTSPSTPCAHEVDAIANNTSATQRIPIAATRIEGG
jgi:hypothetical protein